MKEDLSKYEVITNEAVRRAQQLALKSPPQIGDLVAHPSDEKSYYLRHVDEKTGMATVGYFDAKKEKEVDSQYPLNELFDVNVAIGLAMKINVERKLNAVPNN
jgi:hypothetical protein